MNINEDITEDLFKCINFQRVFFNWVWHLSNFCPHTNLISVATFTACRDWFLSNIPKTFLNATIQHLIVDFAEVWPGVCQKKNYQKALSLCCAMWLRSWHCCWTQFKMDLKTKKEIRGQIRGMKQMSMLQRFSGITST